MAEPVDYAFDAHKSEWLRRERGIGFEEIIEYIEAGWVLGIIPHPNQKAHPDQWVYEIAVEGYIFEVPFYYIEYGIAQLGAIGMWMQYKKNKEKVLGDVFRLKYSQHLVFINNFYFVINKVIIKNLPVFGG